MITTPQEYYQHLHQIQSNNSPSIALIPNREKIYNIDLSSRTIESPRFIGVEKDQAAETIYFLVDRYHDHSDLMNTTCIIHYINANGQARTYAVPFYDVNTYSDQNKMLIPWNVGAGATIAPGKIEYSIRFYRINSTLEFEYNLTTLPATSEVLQGMPETEEDATHVLTDPTEFQQLSQRIEEISRQDVYWTDLYFI